MELPPFTLIAATTRIALLSSPLRSRFSGGTFRLEFYTEEEIKKIVNGSLKAYEDKATSSSLFKDKELTEEQTKILTSYVTFMNSAHMSITQGLFLINESFNGII